MIPVPGAGVQKRCGKRRITDLSLSEERLLVFIIKEYVKFFEKRKYDKALDLILKNGYKLIDIFGKIYYQHHLLEFGSIYNILTDLVKSFLGKHQHANDKRIFRYLRQLYDEFKYIEKMLYTVKKI